MLTDIAILVPLLCAVVRMIIVVCRAYISALHLQPHAGCGVLPVQTPGNTFSFADLSFDFPFSNHHLW